jgi:hypothetical protein
VDSDPLASILLMKTPFRMKHISHVIINNWGRAEPILLQKSLKMAKNDPIFDGLLLLIYISEVKNRIVSSKYNDIF